MYLILRFFGLAPFSIVGDITDGKINTSILDIVHLLFILGVQIYVMRINVYNDLSLSRTSSFLIDKGAHGIEIFNGFNVFLGTFLYSAYRKRIWRILRTYHDVDKEVQLAGLKILFNYF